MARSKQCRSSSLITARLGSRSYLSVQPLVDNEEKAWMLYAYELAGPDRLLVRNAKLDFWKRAVRDKIVGGEITKSAGSESVRVTASGEELRKVVLGYGAVLFEDEVAIEFHRDLKTKPAR
jgi:hypothetical protein